MLAFFCDASSCCAFCVLSGLKIDVFPDLAANEANDSPVLAKLPKMFFGVSVFLSSAEVVFGVEEPADGIEEPADGACPNVNFGVGAGDGSAGLVLNENDAAGVDDSVLDLPNSEFPCGTVVAVEEAVLKLKDGAAAAAGLALLLVLNEKDGVAD